MEHGSEFHLMEPVEASDRFVSPWSQNGLLFGTGRDAIKGTLTMGMESMGWNCLWVPAYFCQGVVESMAETGIRVRSYYSWYPGNSRTTSLPVLKKGDVLFTVNHFGLLRQSDPEFAPGRPSAVIEDHSHDPWSLWACNSTADYCVASLRKTLPIPDGGVAWSPLGRRLPDAPPLTEQHRAAAEEKLEAMKLKAQYLSGTLADKSRYRTLSVHGEEHLSHQMPSGALGWTKDHLETFPMARWRDARRANHESLRLRLSTVKWAEVISSGSSPEVVPFSCIIVFDTPERREYVRRKLIESDIYPAILWSLSNPAIPGIPAAHAKASGRMLSVHCDMRYSRNDMVHVGDHIERYGQEFDEYRTF
ncbi:MAG TPA: hypothetical protein VMM37_07960 [Bacteroidota bacterium]|nr:hypothetical protein [Bacteroidota bacterium]